MEDAMDEKTNHKAKEREGQKRNEVAADRFHSSNLQLLHPLPPQMKANNNEFHVKEKTSKAKNNIGVSL